TNSSRARVTGGFTSFVAMRRDGFRRGQGPTGGRAAIFPPGDLAARARGASRSESARGGAGPRALPGAGVRIQLDLAQAHRLRGDLDAFVARAELQALLQGQ